MREVQDPGAVQQDATLVPHQVLRGGGGAVLKSQTERTEEKATRWEPLPSVDR